MNRPRTPTKRRTITLTDIRWEAVAAYQQEHGILSTNDTIDRLVAAGLTVKVATVGKNAKRKSL